MIITLERTLAMRDDTEFPVTSLPTYARSLCLSVHESIGVPIPMVAMNMLGIASTALGGGAYTELIRRRRTSPNLYVLISAPSGLGKSACYNTLCKPLNSCEKLLIEKWQESKLLAQAEVNILNQELTRFKKAISKGGATDDLRSEWVKCEKKLAKAKQRTSEESRPWIMLNDFTEESLGVSCSHQPHQALGVHTPEGRGFFKIIMGRYGSNGATAENIFLAGFTGDDCKVTRLSRAAISVKPCLTLLVAVQDDVFRRALDDYTFTESGLFPRCLIYRCMERVKPRQGNPPPVDPCLIASWNEKITCLVENYRHSSSQIEFVYSDKAALAIHREANRELDRNRKRSDVHDAYAARYGENLIKVCMVLHSLCYGASSHSKRIVLPTVKHGIKIMRWMRKEQVRLLGHIERDAINSLKDRVLSLMQESGGDYITLRKLRNSHNISHDDCSLLDNHFSYFRVEQSTPGKKGGRPSMRLTYTDPD